MAGDPRFKALLDEMWELHCEKGEGYGTDTDPLANLRDASDWGLYDFMGAFLRAGDKFQRLKNHVRKGVIPGDSMHNDARDGAAYLLLGLILYEELPAYVPPEPKFRYEEGPVDEMFRDVKAATARERTYGPSDA